MKKILFFLILSGLAFGQKIGVCNLSENELQLFSEKLASPSGITSQSITKKTSLGYVVKFEKDLKIMFTNDGGKYSLYDIQGKNEVVKNIWKSFFNPSYTEESKDYSNDVLKDNGADIRLQNIAGQYYIQKYSCQN
ncbi:hypothetical protein [Chryseobacterium cucumeris]|uniref:hypothetical protein n=1 Tax=Chryseobacterium cucumeris TaxID=1813611 RepID=UPI0037C1A07B